MGIGSSEVLVEEKRSAVLYGVELAACNRSSAGCEDADSAHSADGRIGITAAAESVIAGQIQVPAGLHFRAAGSQESRIRPHQPKRVGVDFVVLIMGSYG